jgi:cystathionine gamma-synthase
MIDSTFATPINQRPLTFGIDLVVHSATKYLGGHNDIIAGAVVGRADLLVTIKQHRGLLGSITDPHTASLLERGLKTLGLRVQQQNKNAEAIARYLEQHPRVERVWYPALESHPDYAIAHAQMDGFGGVVSFEVKVDVDASTGSTNATNSTNGAEVTAAAVMDRFTIAQNAPSLGGVETLIMQPALASYYALTAAERAALGIKDNLIRYAVGVEDLTDLLADLEQALEK